MRRSNGSIVPGAGIIHNAQALSFLWPHQQCDVSDSFVVFCVTALIRRRRIYWVRFRDFVVDVLVCVVIVGVQEESCSSLWPGN